MTEMTPEQAAEILNNNQYGSEGSKDFWDRMKASGLVAVYGASDDLMEFSGAIDDELSAQSKFWGTITAYVNVHGLVINKCDEGDACPNWSQTGRAIKALWCPENVPGAPSWAYETDIPHVTFNIMDGDDLYCVGIIFRLSYAGYLPGGAV